MPFAISRRASAVVAALATPLAVAGLSVATAPAALADSVDPASMLLAQGQFVTNAQSPDSCSSIPYTSPTPVPLSAGTVTGAATGTTQLNGSAADVESGTVASTTTVNVAQSTSGQLSKIALTTSFTGQIAASGQGARCHLTGVIEGEAMIGFTLAQPTYVTFTGTSHGGEAIGYILPGSLDSSALGLGFGVPDDASISLTGGHNGTGTSRLLLQPGPYSALLGGGGGPSRPGTASGTDTAVVSFDVPGVALTGATGKGHKYVALPSSVSCSTSTAAAVWTKKAGKHKQSKVKKATFKAEAQKVGTAKKPTKHKTTTLKGLPTDAPFTVTATIKLASGKTVTVSRDYQACTA